MKNLWLIALLFLLGRPVSAQTEEFPETSGNAFLRLCSVVDKTDRTDAENLDAMACVGYMSGFTSGVEFEQLYAKTSTRQKVPAPFCIPDGVERGQMVRIVLKYIRDNPAEANEHTALLVIKALRKAYPCPSK